jgi:hypothetical protein
MVNNLLDLDVDISCLLNHTSDGRSDMQLLKNTHVWNSQLYYNTKTTEDCQRDCLCNKRTLSLLKLTKLIIQRLVIIVKVGLNGA